MGDVGEWTPAAIAALVLPTSGGMDEDEVEEIEEVEVDDEEEVEDDEEEV